MFVYCIVHLNCVPICVEGPVGNMRNSRVYVHEGNGSKLYVKNYIGILPASKE